MTPPLTDREEEVRSLVAKGLGTDEIAAELGISKRTVEAHLRNLFQKLGVTRRRQLAAVRTRPDVTQRTPAVVELDAALGLKAENEKLARQVASYDAAMRQLIERQFPLFDESVEITVTVGACSGEDLVVERHRTKPKPYLPYRVARPITPPGRTSAAYDDLAVTCEVVGQDIGVALQPVPEPGNRLLILVFFQPGLHDSTEWALRYRAPGLFDELRRTGEQTLSWSTSTLDNPSTPGIGEVTFYFEFLAAEDGATVGQDRQTGDLKEDPLPGGARYTWHNFVPGRHEWILRMPSGGQ
jgi:DNA-binding CsgD family transcriptional regulator